MTVVALVDVGRCQRFDASGGTRARRRWRNEGGIFYGTGPPSFIARVGRRRSTRIEIALALSIE
jgi:hypothetical protein